MYAGMCVCVHERLLEDKLRWTMESQDELLWYMGSKRKPYKLVILITFIASIFVKNQPQQEQQQQQRAQSKQQLSICIYVLAMPPEGRKMSARTLKMIYNGKVSQKERGKG